MIWQDRRELMGRTVYLESDLVYAFWRQRVAELV